MSTQIDADRDRRVQVGTMGTSPTVSPPDAADSAEAQSRPRPLASVDGARAADEWTAPALSPPAEEEVRAVAAVWQSNRTISALWTINEVRNAWMHADGLGWRKLSSANDSGLVALNALASHARQLGTPVASFREESDAMVHEIYVW